MTVRDAIAAAEAANPERIECDGDCDFCGEHVATNGHGTGCRWVKMNLALTAIREALDAAEKKIEGKMRPTRRLDCCTVKWEREDARNKGLQIALRILRGGKEVAK